MSNDKATIGVFFGSRTPEHDVSIITADLVMRGLSSLGYEVMPVYIAKDGRWYLDTKLADLDFFKGEGLDGRLSQLKEYALDLHQSRGQMVFISKKGFLSSNEITIDIAFPAIHGQNGEDGSLQGLFELCNIPYVGADVAASSRAMDKVFTKLILQRFKFPTPKFTYLLKGEWESHKNEIIKEIESIGYPVFIKPARAGSSIGISRADDRDELEFAVDVALHYDTKVLVEEGIEDSADITVAVLGNDDPETSLIQESVFEDDFFSYEDKYLNEGGAQLGNAEQNIIIPAELDEDVTEDIRERAIDIYRAFECSGTARVDFLYDREEKIAYATEINTLPGTLYHHLWKKSGVSLSELLKRLLDLAQERHGQKQKITSTFDSDILAFADSNKLGEKITRDVEEESDESDTSTEAGEDE